MALKQVTLLFIHSSFSELKVFGLNPDQLLDSILNFIGEESTLVIPAIQIYPNELTKTELSEADLMAARYVYDPESKRIWTGALAKSLISRKGSVRSLHPLNSVVAFGPKASWILLRTMRDAHIRMVQDQHGIESIN